MRKKTGVRHQVSGNRRKTKAYWLSAAASCLAALPAAGCVQPGAVAPGAVQGVVFDANGQPFKDAVKIALLSPEVTLALSSHVETVIMPRIEASAEARLDVKLTSSVEAAIKQHTGSWGITIGNIEGGALVGMAAVAVTGGVIGAYILRGLWHKATRKANR